MNNHIINEEEVIEKDNNVTNIIRVCRGTICHVNNSADILRLLKKELNINSGETTKDKNFSIEVVPCIDACSISPVIRINNDYYGRIEIRDIPNILNKYRIKKNKINFNTVKAEMEINSN